jgi:DNA-binding NarL/FixJ family response regulator
VLPDDPERGIFGTCGGSRFRDKTTQKCLQIGFTDNGCGGGDQGRDAIQMATVGHVATIPLASLPVMTPLRILLVDDHEVVRAGLKSLIDSQEDMTVVGEAATADEAVRRVGYDSPDVVVLDVRLPDRSGVEACRDIRSRFPEVKALMLTSFADAEALMAAILAGASGYVLKRIRSTELLDDIRRVGAGESLLDPEMTERLFSRLRNGSEDDPLLSRLTKQERVIVTHISNGLTNRQIAEEMFLAEKTVKNYVSTLLAKMGMSRRSEAAAHVARVQAGLGESVTAESWDDLPTTR